MDEIGGGHPSGADQFVEKGLFEVEMRPRVLQGLKPNVGLIGFIGTTEVMPCYKAFEIGEQMVFSAACEARLLFCVVCGKVENW